MPPASSVPTVLVTRLHDCNVYSTGWRSETIDLSTIAAANQGAGVTLRFRTTEADAAWDTVVLLDNIRIVTQ